MHRHRDHGVLAPNAKRKARVTVIGGPEPDTVPDFDFDQSLPDEFEDRPVPGGTQERFVIVAPENALTVPKSSRAWRIDGASLGVWVLTWTTRVTTFLVS